jgi:hypothetical protein
MAEDLDGSGVRLEIQKGLTIKTAHSEWTRNACSPKTALPIMVA